MPIRLGAATPSNLYLGGAPIRRIYLGSVKAWQGWTAARMNLGANVAGTGANWLDVNNVSAADSQTVMSSNSVVIQGTKSGARVTVQANVSGGSAPASRVRILVNNAVVATSGANGSSFSYGWTGNLKDGDLVRFQYYGEGSFFSRPTLQASSYLTIA